MALSMSTYLFFFRIKAVFSQSKSTIWFFVILRLFVSTGAVLQATGATASHMGPTKECFLIGLQAYCATSTFAVALNDTIVVIAITIQLLLNSMADNWRARLRTFIRGKGLGQVSRILLRTNQQYYM